MTPRLQPEFVEFIPEVLEDGKLYISETYATAAHNCCCGCGLRVVTPLSATGWKLRVDGQYVSLHPSIGNWSFPCRSHYWIRRNVVHWSYPMRQKDVDAMRRRDATTKERYFTNADQRRESILVDDAADPSSTQADWSFWRMLKKWWTG